MALVQSPAAPTGRAGRGRLTVDPGPWRRRRRRIVAVLLLVCLLLLGGLGFLIGYAALTLPSLDRLGGVTATVRVLDRHGNLIAEVGAGNQPHPTVTIDQIAPVMQAAIVAAEDRSFYSEGAINAGRILRAAVVDVLLRQPAQGASTITQQLARTAFLPDDRSVMRKLREVLLADQIDQRYSKPKILEMYLNMIYFGHGAYGIEEASETYFGKHASQLNLAEASLLAGLPQAPSSDDPFIDPGAAFARQHYVLDAMVQTGSVTADQALAVDPSPALGQAGAAHRQAMLADLQHGTSPTAGDPAPHFVEYVREQLAQLFAADPAALDSHLTVTTTLDLATQQRAQDAVASGVQQLGRNANNGALLMLDARTGDIIAMVGSADYGNNAIAGQFNVVTAERRPGSSFKPYVYETGYRSGAFDPNTTLDDTAAESAKLGGVNDFDGQFLGQLPAWQALLLSRNVAAEQAMERAGTGNVIDFAHSLGITSQLDDNASTAIGTSSVRMIEHAAAYAAFANGGHTVTARAILRVTDDRGDVLLDAGAPPQGTTVMTPQQAWAITGDLRHYDNQWQVGIHRDTAGKSGTTDSFVDAWYMAYTPDWVVATWAGHTDGANPAEVPMDGVYGTDVGRAIAAPFINGLPASDAFSAPPGAWQFGGAGEPPAAGGKGGGGHHHGHG